MIEIIQTYSLTFHNAILSNIQLTDICNDHETFGVLSFTIENNNKLKFLSSSKKHIHFIFNIDNSGSMDDECKDGRTKMRHIIYTLENMLKICYEKVQEKDINDLSISIYVQIFDSTVTPIITNVNNILDHNIDDLIKIIRNIKPRGSTNISEALEKASSHISEYQTLHNDHEIVHILLTDGEITCGAFDHNILKGKLIVNNLCTNVFIGYGKTHDSNLLSNLANINKGQYRIVDILENAGLVYGEIVHGIFYKILDNAKLYCENDTTIYNYLTNEWVTELELDPLSCEQKKDYQIRSNISKNNLHLQCCITLEGTFNTEKYVYTFKPTTSTNQDLTKYVLRQKTQELLYKSRENERKNNILNTNMVIKLLDSDDEEIQPNNNKGLKIKEELKELHKVIVTYLNENISENDLFLRNLADDIYICYKTIGTNYGGMFTYARQISQGKQQTYTCSSINDTNDNDNTDNNNIFNFKNNTDDNDLIIPVTPMKDRKIHKNSKKGKVGFNSTPFTFVVEDTDTNTNSINNLYKRNTTIDNINNFDYDYDMDCFEDSDINTYTLSNNIISPYKTSGIVDMMTQMSKTDISDDDSDSE
jgi:hypothetical protein